MKKVIIVIVILAAILGILFLTGAIDLKENNENKVEETNEPWVIYLLNSDINSIKVRRSIYHQDGEDEVLNKELTKNDLEKLLTKIEKYDMVKEYSDGSGFTYGDELIIEYSSRDKNYVFNLSNDSISFSLDVDDEYNDLALFEAFANSKYTLVSNSFKTKNSLSFFIFKNFDNKIYDEFFK